MRKKIVSKEELIAIGLNIIANEGVDKCSIRRLAKESDIGVGTVYNYFKSSQDFMIAAFETSWCQTFEHLEALADEDLEPVQRILRLFDITFEDVKKRNHLGMKLYNSYSNGQVPQFKAINDRFHRLVAMNLQTFEEGPRKEALTDWIVILMTSHIRQMKPLSEGDLILFREILSQ